MVGLPVPLFGGSLVRLSLVALLARVRIWFGADLFLKEIGSASSITNSVCHYHLVKFRTTSEKP